MCVNSLPKTVTRQRRSCDLNPGPSAPEYSTLTTRLPGVGDGGQISAMVIYPGREAGVLGEMSHSRPAR